MTDEIKEKIKAYYVGDDIDKVLDYITNLQQLYENGLKVNQNENKYRTELEGKYVVLQQENEDLKTIIKQLNNIINELEKYHIKSMKNLENTEDFKYVGINHTKILYEEHKRTLNKLKELKENEK